MFRTKTTLSIVISVDHCFVRTYHAGFINPIKSLPSGRHLQLLASGCLRVPVLQDTLPKEKTKKNLKKLCRCKSVLGEINDEMPFYVTYSNRQLCICTHVVLS